MQMAQLENIPPLSKVLAQTIVDRDLSYHHISANSPSEDRTFKKLNWIKILDTLDAKAIYLLFQLLTLTELTSILILEKTSIPHRCRPCLIPSWDINCQHVIYIMSTLQQLQDNTISKAMKLSGVFFCFFFCLFFRYRDDLIIFC